MIALAPATDVGVVAVMAALGLWLAVVSLRSGRREHRTRLAPDEWRNR